MSNTIEELSKYFPGRENEIQLLYDLFGHSYDYVSPIWISGASGVGKTVVIRHLMDSLKLNYTLSNCIESFTLKLLVEDILFQLTKEDNSCIRLCDFINNIKNILYKKKETTYIIIDNAHLLRTTEQSNEYSLILPTFLRISSLTKCNICPIFISRLVWPKIMSDICTEIPIQIHFSTYSKDDILSIIAMDCPDNTYKELHNYLASLLFNIFSLVTRDLNELRRLTGLLYPRIVQPVINGEMSMNDKVKLYQFIDPYVRQVSRHIYLNDFSIKEWENEKQNQQQITSSNLAVELPSRLKWLLVASYIASNNPPNHDSLYFGEFTKKSKRSASKKSKIRRRFAMPTSFSFDRMIAIYFAIYEDKSHNRTPTQDSELFTQVQTLISLNLLTLAGSRSVIEAVKLRCNISYDFVKTLAQNLDFELSKYLQDA